VLLFAFELERDVSTIVYIAKNLGNAIVVDLRPRSPETPKVRNRP
jgi:hypothetical protein